MRKTATIFCVFALAGCLLLSGCAGGRKATKTDELIHRGRFDRAAVLQEKIARKSRGPAASEAWYQAGKLWLEPGNTQRSFQRALTCFGRVNRSKASPETARDTRLWVSVLSQLMSARESAAALKDAAEGSERLRMPPAQ